MMGIKIGDNEISIKNAWLWVLGVLLATIIGNSFWDYMFKPGMSRLTEVTINGLSMLSTGFSNTLFRLAARSISDGTSLVVLSLSGLTALLITGLTFIVLGTRQTILWNINKLRTKNEVTNDETKSFKIMNAILLPFAILFALLVIVFSQIATYSSSLSKNVRNNLTIISYTIPEETEEKILSDFVQVQTKAEFLLVRDQIQKIADQNKIKIYWED